MAGAPGSRSILSVNLGCRGFIRSFREAAFSSLPVLAQWLAIFSRRRLRRFLGSSKKGTTYEQVECFAGQRRGRMACGVSAVCRNPPPYIVDLPCVFAGTANYSGCAPAYKCTGVCYQTPFSSWTCTGTDPTKAFCTLLLNGAPNNPKQSCDLHPEEEET